MRPNNGVPSASALPQGISTASLQGACNLDLALKKVTRHSVGDALPKVLEYHLLHLAKHQGCSSVHCSTSKCTVLTLCTLCVSSSTMH